MRRRPLAFAAFLAVFLIAIWWFWPSFNPNAPTAEPWQGTLGWEKASPAVRTSPLAPLPMHSAEPLLSTPRPTPRPTAQFVLGSEPHGTVRVRARYEGPQPSDHPSVSRDSRCPEGADADARLIVHGGAVANVFAHVLGVKALPSGGLGAILIKEEGCNFVPRVRGAPFTRQIAVRSNDPTSRSFHVRRLDAHATDTDVLTEPLWFGTEFKMSAMRFGKPADLPVSLSDDAHPWTKGFLFITWNEWFAVTGTDGIATIDIPVGNWQIAAWHEVLGSTTSGVSVVEGQTVDLTFDFTR